MLDVRYRLSHGPRNVSDRQTVPSLHTSSTYDPSLAIPGAGLEHGDPIHQVVFIVKFTAVHGPWGPFSERCTFPPTRGGEAGGNALLQGLSPGPPLDRPTWNSHQVPAWSTIGCTS